MSKKLVSMPLDGEGNAAQLTPPVVALAQTRDATVSSSTEITLNTGTTFIEVHAYNKGLYMKWGTANVTNANFDEFIPAGVTRQYFVPEGQTAVNFLEQGASATLLMIEK